jgi:D-alanyl-D-alanine carboxypeptidase (penicillin-binding protein 5/6)
LIRDFPEEYKWYSEKEYTYNDITQHNRNKLLWRDSSVDGLKTGHTEEAGYCLAASAKRGSMRLISVVLGTRSENVRAQETQKLLNYGFRFFETHHLYKTNAIITDTKIWKGERDNLQLGVTQDLVITVPRGQYDQLNAVTNVTQPVVAPITAGTVLGEVEITLGDELIAKEQLVALSDVPKGSWWRQLVDTIMLLIFG